ncbi:MAG TPA: alcohol dehydrogenase catalytic domain-containing protein [Bryobacteraceae bacterium]|nr:alcohol dehydrogenase catalytic domain-containing protein [Bryobacteraceae bacterium]
MRALALDFETRVVAEREVPEPFLQQDTEVLFRVLEIGICGTDRALAQFELGSPPKGASHLVLGHEALGEVIATGTKVQSLQVGDLVAPMVRRSCSPPCVFCAKKRRDACISGNYTERGIVGAHGYFTSLAVDHAADLVVIPAGLRAVAVLMEPLSVVEKAVHLALHAYEDRPRKALILGAGPIGILLALVLLARGIEVIVHSLEPPSDIRARILQDAGASYLENDPPQADLVFEAAGSADAAFLAVRQLAPSGVAVILGAFNGEGAFPFRDLILGNRKVMGSVNATPMAMQDAVQDLQRIAPRHLHQMIERVPANQFTRTLFRAGAAPKFVHVLEE